MISKKELLQFLTLQQIKKFRRIKFGDKRLKKLPKRSRSLPLSSRPNSTAPPPFPPKNEAGNATACCLRCNNIGGWLFPFIWAKLHCLHDI